MIPIHVSLNHYKKPEIQKEIVLHSKDREVAARFNESFSKRPDVLRNDGDVLELAKQGASSFHASEELWKNPLQLDASLRRQELDNLRIGWDLVLDIDCGIFEYSRIAADLVVKALKFNNVKSVSCKFSGNKGFHIGVPFEAFTEKINNQETKNLFPEAPRRVAFYIKEMIKKPLGEKISKIDDFNTIIEKTGKKAEEITYQENKVRILNAEPFLAIDTILLSSRHLYRMPYSLHEKSGLVSVPVDPEKIQEFTKDAAIPKNVAVSKFRFLDKSNVEKDDAKQLIMNAFDFSVKREDTAVKNVKEFEAPQTALLEELFPPCVKIILEGIDDGKKRALLVLINYFTSIGWDYDMIDKKLHEWNKKNKDPIHETYLTGQLRYHKQMRKKVLPPNCSNEMYMLGIGVCKPDNFCPRIKNPAQYSTKKAWLINNDKSSKGKKKENEVNAGIKGNKPSQ